MLNPIASGFLVGSYIALGLILIVLMGGILYALIRLNRLLEENQAKIEPVIAKVDSLLVQVTELTETFGGKTEAILGESEATVEVIHDRVERTAEVVQKTVTKPVVGVNALVAGVASGAATFATLQKNSTRNRPAVTANGTAHIRNDEEVSGVELNGSSVK